MINHLELEKAILQSGFSTNGKYIKLLKRSPEEVIETVKNYRLNKLEVRQRASWKLYEMFEKQLCTSGIFADKAPVVQAVFKQWNEENNVRFSYAAFDAVYTEQFRTVDMRRAFIELCEGEMVGYKAFDKNNDLFMKYFIRTLMTKSVVLPMIIDYMQSVSEKIYDLYFTQNSNVKFETNLKQMGFASYKKLNDENVLSFHNRKIDIYRKMERVEQPVFVKGIQKIIMQTLNNNCELFKDSEITLLKSKTLLNQPTKEMPAKEPVYFKQPKITETPIVVEAPTAKPVTAEVTVVAPQAQLVTEQIVMEQLTQATAGLETAKTMISQLVQQETDKLKKNYEERFKIAEEQIERMENMVKTEKNRSSQIQQDNDKKLVEQIAGRKSNYLLSELYKVSVGQVSYTPEIQQGLLLNLFNELQTVMELEPYTGDYQIGDEFSVTRQELAHYYYLINEIMETSEQIHVQMLHCGWMIHGQVVIQPVVQELKGAL